MTGQLVFIHTFRVSVGIITQLGTVHCHQYYTRVSIGTVGSDMLLNTILDFEYCVAHVSGCSVHACAASQHC